jgi:TonB-linked SusC/RagA family outer membrane protein
MKYKIFCTFIFLFICCISFAQQKTITGLVKDAVDGEGIPGVTVLNTKTQVADVTDPTGAFSITASPTDTLLFKYLGKKQVSQVVGQRTVIEVLLYDDETILEEVVVTAFGRSKKSNVASSIESVKVSDLRVAASNLTSALSGRIAGLVSYQTTGEPGADNADFFVRGVGSFGYKAEPLILIDGFESTRDDLARVRIDDVESFSVMKDAAATVMYGARSANGIVSVTTKSGFEGPTRVSARLDFNMAMPTRSIEFLDGPTYMRLYNEAQLTRNPNFSAFYDEQKIQSTIRGDNPMIYPNVNWYDELFNKQTYNQKGDINISGGGQAAKYYVSTGFDHETGLLKVDKRNNFNNNININRVMVRSNVIFNLGRTTKLDTRISGRFERYTGPAVPANNIFRAVMWSNPVDFPAVYEPDAAHRDAEHVLFGSTFVANAGRKVNPYAEMVRGYQDRNDTKITAQATLNQDFGFLLEGLTASLKFSAETDSKYSSTRSYSPFYYALDKYDQITGEYTLLNMTPLTLCCTIFGNTNTQTSRGKQE